MSAALVVVESCSHILTVIFPFLVRTKPSATVVSLAAPRPTLPTPTWPRLRNAASSFVADLGLLPETGISFAADPSLLLEPDIPLARLELIQLALPPIPLPHIHLEAFTHPLWAFPGPLPLQPPTVPVLQRPPAVPLQRHRKPTPVAGTSSGATTNSRGKSSTQPRPWPLFPGRGSPLRISKTTGWQQRSFS